MRRFVSTLGTRLDGRLFQNGCSQSSRFATGRWSRGTKTLGTRLGPSTWQTDYEDDFCLTGLTILRNVFLIKKFNSISFVFLVKTSTKPCHLLKLFLAYTLFSCHFKVNSRIRGLLACFSHPLFVFIDIYCTLLQRFTPNTVHHKRFSVFFFSKTFCCCCWEA